MMELRGLWSLSLHNGLQQLGRGSLWGRRGGTARQGEGRVRRVPLPRGNLMPGWPLLQQSMRFVGTMTLQAAPRVYQPPSHALHTHGTHSLCIRLA